MSKTCVVIALTMVAAVAGMASAQAVDWGTGSVASNMFTSLAPETSAVRILSAPSVTPAALLARIDLLSVASTRAMGVAFGPGNALYINGQNGNLYRVDGSQAAPTLTNLSGANAAGAPTGPMTFDPITGKAFAADARYLYSNDLKAGSSWVKVNAAPYAGVTDLVGPGAEATGVNEIHGQPTASAYTNEIFVRNLDGITAFNKVTGAARTVVTGAQIEAAGGMNFQERDGVNYGVNAVEYFGQSPDGKDLLVLPGFHDTMAPVLVNTATGALSLIPGSAWLDDKPRVIQLVNSPKDTTKTYVQDYFARLKLMTDGAIGANAYMATAPVGAVWASDYFLASNSEPWGGGAAGNAANGGPGGGDIESVWGAHRTGLAVAGSDIGSSWLTPADANRDKMVDVGDLGILGANYGTTTGANWLTGDFTGDGAVDVGDLGVLGANYGVGVPTGAVPEPATLSLLALGVVGLIRRRR